ncbi:MAG TPA: zinc-binding dehydrogenase [Chloroflexota bacterium]|jgi:NADPH:quinone reductase-like Zn-dependent oxidoreductase
MKAVVIHEHGGPEVLRYEDVPDPTPGPGEALIRVHAVSVNRTLDTEVRTGTYLPLRFPHVLGPDPAGEVVALGEGATGVAVGDRVVPQPLVLCGDCPACRAGRELHCLRPGVFGVHRWGGDAQYATAPTRGLIRIPDGLTYQQASAIMIMFPTAWHLLAGRARVQPGETVLVMGAAGSLGLAGVQVAKYLGARVIAAAGADWKLERVQALGADAGVNYYAHKLSEEVLRLTDGLGADVVFENISSRELFSESMASLARGGRLVTCGTHGGGVVEIALRPFYVKQQSILGSAGATRAETEEVYRLIAAGHMQPIVEHVLPLEQAAAGHRLAADRNSFGRVVLEVP